ncbi:uncharacterized protein LOC133124821 isoform X2 [Conger conger]|uniref:uncharacterized protein LOC133124821 isoform X2 n=1 Tax=Conger conger TaxID=82655 RepID=UPI002A5A496B|nr:uncharacterized protein LOC133124821 isoform X2 [Conger conger]
MGRLQAKSSIRSCSSFLLHGTHGVVHKSPVRPDFTRAMPATGLHAYLLLSLLLGVMIDTHVRADQTEPAGVCKSLRDYQSTAMTASTCPPVTGRNFCLPRCGELEDNTDGCQRPDTCRPVIPESCLKDGCKLCENAQNITQVNCTADGCKLCENAQNITQVNCTADGCKLCENAQNITQVNCTAELKLECIRDFQVEVIADSFSVEEGSNVNMTCNHSLPAVHLFVWFRNGKVLPDKNDSHYLLAQVLKKDEAKFSCGVLSACGFIVSEKKPLEVTDNSVLIIIICGVAAVAIVLFLALLMKIMLKRERRNNKIRTQVNTPANTFANISSIT